VIFRGFKNRFFKTLPIGKKRVFLVLKVHRIQCNQCGCIRQMKLGFADPKKSYTRTLARYVLELLKMSTIEDVAKHLKMSWNTIKQIQKMYLEKNFGTPDLANLQQIAIDEISLGKKHKYITLVIDLLSGAVVFIGDGKGADALTPFWEKLKEADAVIKAVAMDMSTAYISAVRSNLPDAEIIFDHFHIVKLFNDKLSQLRRELYHETKNYLESQALKGLQWILLKNPENLNEKRNEKELLEKALAVNKPLAAAYYLKEELRQFWSQETKEKAEEFISQWIRKAQSSGVRILQQLGNTIGSHRTGILAYYDYPISTAPIEGTNNKIKTMQRQAYGYRDKEFFKLKIFAIHQTKYALIG
jgi:transposase